MCNPELTKTTTEKLSPTVRYRWYENAATQTEEEPDIVKMARFLNHEAELCSPYAQPKGVSRGQKTCTVESGQGERREEDRSTQHCPACNKEENSTTSCHEFKTAGVSKRRDICKKNHFVSAVYASERKLITDGAAHARKTGTNSGTTPCCTTDPTTKRIVKWSA